LRALCGWALQESGPHSAPPHAGPYSSKARALRLYLTRKFVRIFRKIQTQTTLGNYLFFFFFFPGGSGFYLFHGSHKNYLHSYRPSMGVVLRSAYSSTYQVVVLFLSFFFTAQSVPVWGRVFLVHVSSGYLESPGSRNRPCRVFKTCQRTTGFGGKPGGFLGGYLTSLVKFENHGYIW